MGLVVRQRNRPVLRYRWRLCLRLREDRQIRIVGAVPPEVWNRLGTKLIPKLKAGVNLKLGLSFTLELEGSEAQQFDERF